MLHGPDANEDCEQAAPEDIKCPADVCRRNFRARESGGRDEARVKKQEPRHLLVKGMSDHLNIIPEYSQRGDSGGRIQ